MTLTNSVKEKINLSELFNIVQGFRQDDLLSFDLLLFVMDSVLRKMVMHRYGTIQKSVQLLAYVDDINIIGNTKRNVTAAFSAIGRESTKMGRVVNEGKTKYILLTSRDGPYWISDYGQ